MTLAQPIAVLALLCATLAAAQPNERFRCEITNPNVRVSIPELPQIKMVPHRDTVAKPHLRLEGSSKPFVVTVMAPTSDAGMTPRECASATVKSIMRRERLADADVSLKKAPDGKTFGMYYSRKVGNVVILTAQILSGAGGTHCIHVHITKVGTEADIKEWMEGFPDARVETY